MNCGVLLHSTNYVGFVALGTFSLWWSGHLGAIQARLRKRPIDWYLVRRLQSVLNAAALLIYHMGSADHITDALASLH